MPQFEGRYLPSANQDRQGNHQFLYVLFIVKPSGADPYSAPRKGADAAMGIGGAVQSSAGLDSVVSVEKKRDGGWVVAGDGEGEGAALAIHGVAAEKTQPGDFR